ncbi:rhodanese-related sulfurtransferase [Oligosphaera ethanolica]|uniref:Rhodanese-related sulfurtransferase n=2 Tax=Oligosphaera ethanolica TaxID=760260 RepID=A0AAE3VFV7_9BACT|nr:rhodanese-related sulfurtransferase [Oligosphaera ethanolica]
MTRSGRESALVMPRDGNAAVHCYDSARRGRKCLAASCVVVSLLVGVLRIAANDTVPSPGPRMLVEPAIISLGELDTSAGQLIFPARFALINGGDAPLHISTPRAGCGCTKLQLAKHDLAPGESTELKAMVDVTGRYGPQRFSIFVPNNASKTPSRLVIEATVPDTRTAWELMPPQLPVRDGTPARLQIRLFDKDRDLRITALELPNGCELLTSLPMIIVAGGLGRLDIRCRQDLSAPGGRLPFAVLSDHAEKVRDTGWLLVANEQTSPPDLPAKTAGTATRATVVPIEASTLKDLISSMQVVNDLFLLDIRQPDDFMRGHIPRSLCYPSTRWQLAQPPWPASALLVVIADHDDMAAKAAEQLAASKCRHVLVLRGGIAAWTAAAGVNTLETKLVTEP